MATQAERLDALEMTNGEMQSELSKAMELIGKLTDRLSDVERHLKDGETLDELRDLVAKAAPLSDFEKLTETVAEHGKAIADGTLNAIDGELITISGTEPGDLRGDVLKAFRQIEAVANHINVKLPS